MDELDGESLKNFMFQEGDLGESWTWEPLHMARGTPPQECGQRTVIYNGDCYTFGGYSDLGERTNKMTKMSLRERTCDVLDVRGDIPEPRNFHTMVLYKDNFYVYGGFNQQEERYNEMFKYWPSTCTWERLPMSGTPPPEGLSGHTAVVVNGQMWIFGGGMGRGINATRQNGLFCVDLETLVWSKVDLPGAPSARSSHTAVLYQSSIVIYGGWDGVETYSDLHCLDLSGKPAWRAVETSGIAPEVAYHTAVLMENLMLVVGGLCGDKIISTIFCLELDSRPLSLTQLCIDALLRSDVDVAAAELNHSCKSLLDNGRLTNPFTWTFFNDTVPSMYDMQGGLRTEIMHYLPDIQSLLFFGVPTKLHADRERWEYGAPIVFLGQIRNCDLKDRVLEDDV